MKRFCELFIVVVFIIIIFAVPIASALAPRTMYSVFENRNLAVRPGFSKKELMDGSYFKKWETYFSDHFIGRNQILASYVDLSLNVMKKPVVNDITIQGETLLPYMNYGVLKPEALDKKVESAADELFKLSEHVRKNNGKLYYIGIPGQYSMLRHKYPYFLNNCDESLTYTETQFFKALQERDISYLDMYEKFSKMGNFEDMYSKVDHHYNYLGAFETYQAIMDLLGGDLKRLNRDNLNFETVDLQFYGSRNRKLYTAFFSDEKLMYATPKAPISFTRLDNGKPVQANTFEMPSKGESYATYGAYMGGDVAETIIQTNRPELPNILVFGDSFTNPLEGLLYYSFNEMRALDLRHYKDKTLYEYIDAYKPDIVLCVRDDSVYLNTEGNGTYRK